MNHDRIIDGLIGDLKDSSSELGMRQAYLRCLEYAERSLTDALDYNPFVARAAERFEQHAVFRSVASAVNASGQEKLHLAYDRDTGPVLKGNADGFRWLAAVLQRLAHSSLDSEHVLLNAGDAPLVGDSYGLWLYLEPDRWFAALPNVSTPDDSQPIQPRSVEAEHVIAIRPRGEMPPPLMMTARRIYRIVSWVQWTGQKVWRKELRPETERVRVFRFERDDGVLQEVALDLDDPGVDFLTAGDS